MLRIYICSDTVTRTVNTSARRFMRDCMLPRLNSHVSRTGPLLFGPNHYPFATEGANSRPPLLHGKGHHLKTTGIPVARVLKRGLQTSFGCNQSLSSPTR
jgi:hypothetical protein